MDLNLNSFLQSNNSPLVTREKYSPYNIDEQYERGLIQNAQLSDNAINNAKIRNSYRAYSSVVSTLQGDGDTNDIQEAIDAVNDTGQGGIILIRPGTYYPETPLILYDNISLQGVDPTNTIISFASAGDCSSGCIQVVGTDVTNAGTIAVTSGSSTVTGTSTSFSTDGVASGDLIMINGMAYIVDTVTSDTVLSITETYRGVTQSTISYDIWTSISNVNISDLNIINGASASTAGSGLVINYADNINISGCVLKNHNQNGIEVLKAFDVKVDNCISNSNTVNGIYMTKPYSSYFTNNVTNSNTAAGIRSGSIFTSTNIFIRNNVCNSNGTYGIHLYLAKNHLISGNSLSANTSHGIYLEGSANNNITGNSVNKNGADGIHLTNRISVDSDYNVVVANNSSGNTDDGIELTSGTNYNNASHNLLQNNSGTDLVNNGTGNVAADNT